MSRPHPRLLAFLLVIPLILAGGAARVRLASSHPLPPLAPEPGPADSPSQADMPYFRFPVVPGATISGYFDHHQSSGLVTFFNGRRNNSGAGFYFSCSNPSMYDWVGCEDGVAGEAACSNARELWYDGHHGTDYEFSANWHTGAACDPGRFSGLTMPIYAPAPGQVLIAGTDPNRPANGWHIRLKHDLNHDGNYNNDNFRSIYLHFTAGALAVVPGQIVAEGQYLGLGGSTGYSSSPHLHFEVQRSSDSFQTNYWSVDPYGWQGSGSDPWPYTNVKLWQQNVTYTNFVYLPIAFNSQSQCGSCGELLKNGGFESGHTVWVEQGVQVIANTGDPNLAVSPYSGDWLSWMAGRNNALDTIYQDFTLPADFNGGALRFALMVATQEPGGPQDYLYVRLRQLDGTVIQELILDNTFAPKNQWVQQEVSLVNLSAWKGQTIRISFKATSSASNITDFYLDDVSILASGP